MHCAVRGVRRNLQSMKRIRFSGPFTLAARSGLIVLLGALALTACAEEPTAAATAGFNAYVGALDLRLDRQHHALDTFLAKDPSHPESDVPLHRGDLVIEDLTPSSLAPLSGAMLHHWRGTAFLPGAKAADFERLMKGFDHYPSVFSPQILRAEIISQKQDHYHVRMRVRQKHILTVVMDTDYDVVFSSLDRRNGWSTTKSTNIAEIDAPGTTHEQALSPAREHGILWRLNTYWSWHESDDGLTIQIESVSLTRSIPAGLSWAIRPFIQSIPRESLEFTLSSASAALRNAWRPAGNNAYPKTELERKPA